MALCSATRHDGQACAALALAGSALCFFHSTDAEHKRQRQRGRRAGGISRSHRAATLPADALLRPLTSVAEVLVLLEEAANAVRLGGLEQRLANCVGYLWSIALNGLAQIPAPESPVSVCFVVHEPVPCPECKTATGRECGRCQGLGYGHSDAGVERRQSTMK